MIVYKVTGFWFNKLFKPQTSNYKPQTLQTSNSSNAKPINV